MADSPEVTRQTSSASTMERLIGGLALTLLVLLVVLLVVLPLGLWKVVHYSTAAPDLQITWVKLGTPPTGDQSLIQWVPCAWHPSWGGPADVQCGWTATASSIATVHGIGAG